MLGQQLVNAVVLGSMYALIAVGFTLYFGVLNLINLAHGGVYMLGGFIAVSVYALCSSQGWPVWVCVVAMSSSAILGAGWAGMLIERITVKPLRKAPPLVFLITSVAAYIVLEELVLHFYPNGANPQKFPDPFQLKQIQWGDTVIGYAQIFLVGIALASIAALHLLITRSGLGRSIRAVTADAAGAQMMGIDVNKIISRTFFIGSALAAVGGIMEGINYGSVMFNMGFIAAIKGFTAAVIGGLGNVYGALAGGFVLGMAEVMISAYVPHGGAYKNVVTFALLILCLVFRPQGILGGGGKVDRV